MLKKDGIYCIVVGYSILKGELIRMNENFDKIFVEKLGYNKLSELTFNQRKYTKTFTPNLRSVDKNTYILIYQN